MQSENTDVLSDSDDNSEEVPPEDTERPSSINTRTTVRTAEQVHSEIEGVCRTFL